MWSRASGVSQEKSGEEGVPTSLGACSQAKSAMLRAMRAYRVPARQKISEAYRK